MTEPLTNLDPDTPIFTQAEIAAAQPAPGTLPSPGYVREEELKHREDLLQAKIDEMSAQLETVAVDGAKMKKALEDREVSYHLFEGHLHVSDADPSYMYKWVNFSSVHGTMVVQAKAQQPHGWLVVQGEDPECADFKKEDGTRRIGDVLLMKQRKDHHMVMAQITAEKLRAREFGAESTLQDMADKTGGALSVSRIDANSPHRQRAESTAQTLAAKRLALGKVDGMLRDGNVPGMPAPGIRSRS